MSSEILEKLDKLALDSTVMDESLSDLKATADIIQQADELKELLAKDKQPEASRVFAGLSSVFEKILLQQAPSDSGPTALEILAGSITLIHDCIDEPLSPDELGERAKPLFLNMKEKFDVTPDMPEGANKTEPQEQEDIKLPQASVISLIDENDVEIFEGFLDESTDQINNIEEYVIALEETPEDMGIINSLFRVFHSLKGAAGFLGINDVNFLCHDAENLLDRARKSDITVNSEFIDVVLSVRDLLEKLIASVDELIREGKKQLPNFTGDVEPHDLKPALGAIKKHIAVAMKENDEPQKLGQILLKKEAISAEHLEEALDKKSKPVGEILVEMGATTKENIDEALNEQRKTKTLKTTAIKVDTKKLNLLLELVGELVIAQSIVSQNETLKTEENKRLSKDIVDMAKITGGIQDNIMALRMVPLRQMFQKMNRLVRDLSRKMDKKVNFVTTGEETEIDKTIVEQLNDPLVHLLRNAVDHGLESADERLKAGKPDIGTVTLKAYQQSGNVVIEIRDDGRGLDLEKIREKSIERGLIEKDKTYTEEEIRNLIFLPGLSTHDKATDISGRGVGMDVVRKNIEKLGGRTEIHSKRGEGSVFIVKLPLTMAIVDGMLVKVGQERYIIPTVAISQTIQLKPGQLSKVINKGEIINIRGELIALVRLHELFGISNGSAGSAGAAGSADAAGSLVIIVSTETQKRGLMVDDLLGQHQVVIKNLDNRLRGIKGFSGSSILGDGLVGLILDISAIFDMASAQTPGAKK